MSGGLKQRFLSSKGHLPASFPSSTDEGRIETKSKPPILFVFLVCVSCGETGFLSADRYLFFSGNRFGKSDPGKGEDQTDHSLSGQRVANHRDGKPKQGILR